VVRRDKAIKWLGAVVASFVVALIVSLMGGPVWAVYGFSYLAFVLYRTEDTRA
jgi:hypothetical protein